jgi:quercetin dioxygenase-like cupin family protein
LKGARLKALILIPEFWFAWSEFHPQTKVFLAATTQAGNLKPIWEMLMRAPLPEDAEPKLSVISLPMRPAPPYPGPFGAHRHAGPVFAYILEGEIENQVEPEAPQTYKPGGYFYEAPMHLHSLMRNLSQTEPAKVIVFQAGATGKAAPAIKTLLEAPLETTMNQEVTLRRLTLPPGTSSEPEARSGTGIVYVLEGAIEGGDKRYGAGDLFVDVPSGVLRNAGNGASAKVLIYRAAEKRP